MSYVVTFPSCSIHNSFSPWKCKLLKAPKSRRCTQLWTMKAQMVMTPSTFTTRISTDIPLDEAPEASFAQYLEDKTRVFRAICPEKEASHQLNEDEWRIHMLPVKSPFLTVRPVVDMRLRCNSNVLKYPSGVPHDIPKVLELEIIRSDLQGLEVFKHAQFFLAVKGSLYCDRRGVDSRLKGQTQLSIIITLPPLLALVSEHVCREAAELVLTRLAENMKQTTNASLLADYHEFKRERMKDLA